MALEIEAKLKVDSHDPVRERLIALGAVALGAVVEQNHILDRADGSLRAGGAALRVRRNDPVEAGAANVILTYKGPVQPGQLKRREELEVGLADTDQALAVLRGLGFVEMLTYRKRRESYQLAGCRVELDEVPFLGRFVEIEGPDEQTITEVQEQLGLGALPHVARSYVNLLRRYCRATGLDPTRIDFSTE